MGNGNFLELPISEDLAHSSPFGTIYSKYEYINLIEANKVKFLGQKFGIHDEV